MFFIFFTATLLFFDVALPFVKTQCKLDFSTAHYDPFLALSMALMGAGYPSTVFSWLVGSKKSFRDSLLLYSVHRCSCVVV